MQKGDMPASLGGLRTKVIASAPENSESESVEGRRRGTGGRGNRTIRAPPYLRQPNRTDFGRMLEVPEGLSGQFLFAKTPLSPYLRGALGVRCVERYALKHLKILMVTTQNKRLKVLRCQPHNYRRGVPSTCPPLTFDNTSALWNSRAKTRTTIRPLPLRATSSCYFVGRYIEMLNPSVDEAPVDEGLHEGPPPTAWSDFQHARLRQFPRQESKIKWSKYLGHGKEGVVFKATIDGGSPVVVKVVRVRRFPSGET